MTCDLAVIGLTIDNHRSNGSDRIGIDGPLDDDTITFCESLS